MEVGRALFWVGGGEWENILGDWGWLGMSGGEWGWVHYLIMPVAISYSWFSLVHLCLLLG